MNRPTQYIRLLSYDQVTKLIECAKTMKCDAWIVPNGVAVQIPNDKPEDHIKNFLDGMGWKYEIGTQHPATVTANIIKSIQKLRK